MRNALSPGATVFIDANIFLYKILEHWKYARPCNELLKDVNRGKYSGVISVFVCNEVFHRVMFAELFKEHNIDAKHATKYLKDNPDVLKELWAPGEAIKNIEQIEDLKIVGVGRETLESINCRISGRDSNPFCSICAIHRLPGIASYFRALPPDAGPLVGGWPPARPRPARGPIAPRLAGGWQMDDCIWHYFELLGPCWRHLSTHP
jgi:hypothetical protein